MPGSGSGPGAGLVTGVDVLEQAIIAVLDAPEVDFEGKAAGHGGGTGYPLQARGIVRVAAQVLGQALERAPEGEAQAGHVQVHVERVGFRQQRAWPFQVDFVRLQG